MIGRRQAYGRPGCMTGRLIPEPLASFISAFINNNQKCFGFSHVLVYDPVYVQIFSYPHVIYSCAIESYLVRLIESHANQHPRSRLPIQLSNAYFLHRNLRPLIQQKRLRKRLYRLTMSRNTTQSASGKFWMADIKSLPNWAMVSHLQSGSVAI